MLFKTSSFGAFAVRVASNSEFDHVGLLLRGKNSEIFLYECLGNGGVQLNSIEFFLDNDWDKLYDKIVIRKLVFERTLEFNKSLKKFCSQWLGKPYKLTAKKLMRKNSLTFYYYIIIYYYFIIILFIIYYYIIYYYFIIVKN